MKNNTKSKIGQLEYNQSKFGKGVQSNFIGKCCEIGTYKCDVNVKTGATNIFVDKCISDLIFVLNYMGIKTIASCCGHGKMDGSILLEDGREIIIKEKKDNIKCNHVFPKKLTLRTSPSPLPRCRKCGKTIVEINED